MILSGNVSVWFEVVLFSSTLWSPYLSVHSHRSGSYLAFHGCNTTCDRETKLNLCTMPVARAYVLTCGVLACAPCSPKRLVPLANLNGLCPFQPQRLVPLPTSTACAPCPPQRLVPLALHPLLVDVAHLNGLCRLCRLCPSKSAKIGMAHFAETIF